MYSNDPNYHTYQPVTRVQFWPWVLAGVMAALLLLAYFDPIPERTTPEPISLGPASPLYGPLNTRPAP